MDYEIIDQVVDFYGSLFEQTFSKPFRAAISDPLKRKAVIRQIDEAADAASQSLRRFFLNEKLTDLQVKEILDGYVPLGQALGC